MRLLGCTFLGVNGPLAQDLDVRETEWYNAYRQVVFKLLEDAEEDGATGLGHVKMGKEV